MACRSWKRWLTGSVGVRAATKCQRSDPLPHWAEVDLDVVLRCAETGKLARLVEARSGRKAEERSLTRIRNLYRKRELQARQVPPWSSSATVVASRRWRHMPEGRVRVGSPPFLPRHPALWRKPSDERIPDDHNIEGNDARAGNQTPANADLSPDRTASKMGDGHESSGTVRVGQRRHKRSRVDGNRGRLDDGAPARGAIVVYEAA